MPSSKVHANWDCIVLSVSHLYLLTLVAEFPRLRGDFIACAKRDGFYDFLDPEVEDRRQFAREIRHLSEMGYFLDENVPRHISGTNHCKMYRLTPKGERAIHTAIAAYGSVAKQMTKLEPSK